MTTLGKLLQVNQLLKDELEIEATDKRGLPLSWVNIFLHVALAGDEGILMTELGERLKVTPGTICRAVMSLSADVARPEGSTYFLPRKGIFIAEADSEYRHRKRVFLTRNGKQLATKMAALLK